MKKHSFSEHLESVWDVYWRIHGSSNDSSASTVWFTAYERWLNDRDLMADEDSHPERHPA